LIFSQRRALRAWQDLRRNEVMSTLDEGDVCHGEVTDLTDFGAFVDLGGADGLVHVSELSWKRVDNPRQVLKVGQEIDVYVLNVDRQRKRIALSCKRLQPDPWTLVDEHYEIGQLTEGRVTRVLDFGAFVELDLGIEGLLHVSEMIGTPELQPSQIVEPGQAVLVKIIRIESKRRRVALSAKQVRQNEWERWISQKQAAQEVAIEEADAAASSTPQPETEPIASVAEPPVTAEITPDAAPDVAMDQAATEVQEEPAEPGDVEAEDTQA
jgi:small subunit ribosomal protein S1